MATPDTFPRATITKRIEITNGLWVTRVDPGPQFSFTAGQYATLGVPAAGGLVERAYSIVSSPRERELEFFFELVPGGKLTPFTGSSRHDAASVRTSQMIAHGKAILHRHGWDKGALKEESYFVPASVHA